MEQEKIIKKLERALRDCNREIIGMFASMDRDEIRARFSGMNRASNAADRALAALAKSREERHTGAAQ